MYEEHIDYVPLGPDSPEVLEAEANGTLCDAGAPITDPAWEIDRRTKAYIKAHRLPNDAKTYSRVLRQTLAGDAVLSVRYLGAAGRVHALGPAAQAVTDRVRADPKLSGEDGQTLIRFAELLTKVDPRGGDFVSHLHRCLQYFPDLNALYKAGQL
jgi:hypothetical protein